MTTTRALERCFAAVIAAAILVAPCGCGTKYKASVENQAMRRVFVGIVETMPRGARIAESASLAPGEEASLSVSGESDSAGGTYALMVGDTPSPRERRLLVQLSAGNNQIVIKQVGKGPRAQLVAEREE